MKVFKIDGRTEKVFVLKETEESVVYIPLKYLAYVDYKRLLEIESKGGEMLKEMSRTKLDNGVNALVQYDNIIQVLRLKNKETKNKIPSGSRLSKPTDPTNLGESPSPDSSKSDNEVVQSIGALASAIEGLVKTKSADEESPPARKKPGPKPGFKRGRKDSADTDSNKGDGTEDV